MSNNKRRMSSLNRRAVHIFISLAATTARAVWFGERHAVVNARR